MEPILSLKNVCSYYDKVQVLYDINVDVYPGEIVSVIGANGAGKSTMMKTIMGLVHMGRGEVLRPANLPQQQPGRGWGVFETPFGDVAVIDLIGRCGMDYTPDNPFQLVERILRKIQTKLILVELHAEATSEKLAMGRMLDGQVSAVWGTHTHVPTADTLILSQGTGYVTDLGMTGPRDSVLGIRPELSIRRFRGDLPSRYEPAPGPCKLEACLFTIDDATGRCTAVRRVDIHG